MAFSTLSDETLMQEAAAGRFSAFEEFIQRHGSRIHNFCWRLTGSAQVASTLFESSLPEFYRHRASQAGLEGAVALYFTVATRMAVRALSENPGLGLPQGAAAKGDKASLDWRSARLNDVILSLPLRERCAVLLCFFDSLSYRSAAQCLSEREDNVRNLCAQGLTRLREALGDDFLKAGLN